MEEGLEAGAEVVEPRLPVGRAHEAVLGAAAVAGEAHVALEAVLRQLVELVPTELPLFLRLDLRVLLGFLLINIPCLPVVVAVSRGATRVRQHLYPSPDRRYHMVTGTLEAGPYAKLGPSRKAVRDD